MQLVIPVIKFKKISININPLIWIKSYVFATYKEDKVKFKRRNRFILFLTLSMIAIITFQISFDSFKEVHKKENISVAFSEEETLLSPEDRIAEDTKKLLEESEFAELDKDETKNEYEDINIEEVKSYKEYVAEFDNKENSDVQGKEENNEVEEVEQNLETKSPAKLFSKNEKEEEKIEEKQFFIQVASIYSLKYFQKKLDKLEEHSYKYTIQDVETKKGKLLKKVLVGPFKSYDLAKEQLKIVNELINIKGFIKNAN